MRKEFNEDINLSFETDKNIDSPALETQKSDGEEILELFKNGKINMLPVSLGIINNEGKVEKGNKKFLEALGITDFRDPFQLLSHEETECLKELNTGKIEAYQMVMPSPTHPQRWLQVVFNTVSYKQEHLITASLTDITLHEKEKLELKRINTQMQKDAQTIGHDIKGEMTTIKTGLYILEKMLEKYNPGLKISRITASIGKSVNKIINICLGLRDLSHTPKKEPTDVQEIIKDIIEGHMLELEEEHTQEKHIEVITNFPENLPQISADPNYIRTIFSNLIRNAIHAHPSNITIICDLKEKEGKKEIEIRVKDNGHGIPGEIREDVFKEYFTTKRRTRFEGTGVGLFDVARMVRAHGGTINFESLTREEIEEHATKRPYRYLGLKPGTTFIIRLPLNQAD